MKVRALTTPAPATLQETLTERLRALRDALLPGLIERDLAIRLGLLAALTGEHLLLIGPPGTAKRLVARRIGLAFEDAACLEQLLTRSSTPEELRAAQRQPATSILLLPDLFKAQGPILHTLLALLDQQLLVTIGTSHELHEGEGLSVLRDRFLLWFYVAPVSREGFRELMLLSGEALPPLADHLKLTVAAVGHLRTRSAEIAVPEDVMDLLVALRTWCAQHKLHVSDRRWRRALRLLQMSALTNGRDAVSLLDCWLLHHALAETPEAQKKLASWYIAHLGGSAAREPTRLNALIVSWEDRLQAALNSRTQLRDREGQPLFRSFSGALTREHRGLLHATRDGEPLFLLPHNFVGQRIKNDPPVIDRSNRGKGFTESELEALFVKELTNFPVVSFSRWSGKAPYLANRDNWLMEEGYLSPAMEPARHKPAFISSCLSELNALRSQITVYREGLLREIQKTEHEIRDHLWIIDDLAVVAVSSLHERRAQLELIHSRVESLHRGFGMLPRE